LKKPKYSTLKDGVFVFVYGTLKRGGRLNVYLDPNVSEFVSEGLLDDEYSLYVPNENDGGWFPMVVKEDSTINCMGELFLIDPSVLHTLDQVEGVPNLYTREKVEVTTEDGEVINSYTYIYNPKNRIPNGYIKGKTFNIPK